VLQSAQHGEVISFNNLFGFILAGGAACQLLAPERFTRIQADRPPLQWFQPDFAPATTILPL
jgi:hypothetical protein